MEKLMGCEAVLNLARALIESHPGTLKSPEDYLDHLRESYKIAGEVVNAGISKYPGLNGRLKPEEVALGSGLHDIGRPLRKNQLFHELRGAEYIEKKGLEEGVADSLIDIYRIAQMFRPHYVVFEQFLDEENKQEKREFEPLDSGLLIPRTWQEAIVVYSELSNLNGERVSVEQRITDIQKRYSSDSEYAKSNPSLVRAMEKGLLRVLETCERVQRLVERKLSEEEVGRYGFL